MTLNPQMIARGTTRSDGPGDLLSTELLDSIVDAPNAVQVCCVIVVPSWFLWLECMSPFCDLQWATIKGSVSSLLSSVKSLGDEVAALKRAAARSEADEPVRAMSSRQRTVFAPSLATTGAPPSSPTLTPENEPNADKSRALARGMSTRRKFDAQVRDTRLP